MGRFSIRGTCCCHIHGHQIPVRNEAEKEACKIISSRAKARLSAGLVRLLRCVIAHAEGFREMSTALVIIIMIIIINNHNNKVCSWTIPGGVAENGVLKLTDSVHSPSGAQSRLRSRSILSSTAGMKCLCCRICASVPKLLNSYWSRPKRSFNRPMLLAETIHHVVLFGI